MKNTKRKGGINGDQENTKTMTKNKTLLSETWEKKGNENTKRICKEMQNNK